MWVSRRSRGGEESNVETHSILRSHPRGWAGARQRLRYSGRRWNGTRGELLKNCEGVRGSVSTTSVNEHRDDGERRRGWCKVQGEGGREARKHTFANLPSVLIPPLGPFAAPSSGLTTNPLSLA